MSDHGTLEKYIRDKCRCKRCKQTVKDYSTNRHGGGYYALPKVDKPPIHFRPATTVSGVSRSYKKFLAARVGNKCGACYKTPVEVGKATCEPCLAKRQAQNAKRKAGLKAVVNPPMLNYSWDRTK